MAFWRTNLMWALHNLIAHPVGELCFWASFLCPPLRRFGGWLHDITVPAHDPVDGRG
ncbi:hypothetical protein [Azospirillum sp. Sh1]|uniref:hypothetical protein n=1 Tax=Azospirillum sp. Sh1 TaxID=2607285 RepID=UPI00165EB831|nr:hypothetical protein [Azospirillum sp. Sh1]